MEKIESFLATTVIEKIRNVLKEAGTEEFILCLKRKRKNTNVNEFFAFGKASKEGAKELLAKWIYENVLEFYKGDFDKAMEELTNEVNKRYEDKYKKEATNGK